jgi:hypothetical protein
LKEPYKAVQLVIFEGEQPPKPWMCWAKLRKKQQHCRRPAGQSGRCRLHGDACPKGIQSKMFKNGFHSNYLPKALKSHYDAAIQDPSVLSVRDEVAVLKAKQLEIVKRMAEEEPPPWGQVVEALNDYEIARQDNDEARTREAYHALVQAIRCGYDAREHEAQLWAELREVIQDTTKTAGREWKRLHDLNALLPVADVLNVMVAFLGRIRQRVSDPMILRGIQSDWNDLVAARCSPSKRAQINRLSALRQEAVEGTVQPPTPAAQQPPPVGPPCVGNEPVQQVPLAVNVQSAG